MERICKNCEHFMQKSTSYPRYIWGDCMKPTTSAAADEEKERGTFMWADKTCSDFKPKPKP